MADDTGSDDDWPTIADLDEMRENIIEVGSAGGYEVDAWLDVLKLARAELERRQARPARPRVTFTPAGNGQVEFTLAGYPLTTNLAELQCLAARMASGDTLTFAVMGDVSLVLESDQLRAGLARMDAIYADGSGGEGDGDRS